MSINWLFEGGMPGETYGKGVRRRGKGMLVTMVIVLLSAALIDLVLSLSGSIWLSMAAATLCGIAFIRVGTPFDLPITEISSRAEKLLWLILFTPASLLLAGASAYEALANNAFQAAALAGLFGAVLGGTFMVLSGADSRARVEGTTLATSADRDR